MVARGFSVTILAIAITSPLVLTPAPTLTPSSSRPAMQPWIAVAATFAAITSCAVLVFSGRLCWLRSQREKEEDWPSEPKHPDDIESSGCSFEDALSNAFSKEDGGMSRQTEYLTKHVAEAISLAHKSDLNQIDDEMNQVAWPDQTEADSTRRPSVSA